jgi:outer membrane protein assembly factor BamB
MKNKVVLVRKGDKTVVSLKIILVLFFSLSSLVSSYSQQVNWTHFRGNDLDGRSAEKNVPLKWNDSTNIAWKTKISGSGWSSPVIYGNQIWLTTASEDGKQMFGECVDFKSGKEIFRIKVIEPDKILPKHDFNSFATPTPCIEEGFVYLHFGTYGTACLRTKDGSEVWKRTDLNCDHVQGPASSPVIYKNLLILHIEGTDVQYIVALDKRTGKTVWKTDRPADCWNKIPVIGRKAYITPIIININGRDLLISNGSAACIAYDPETGKEVWRVIQGEDSTIAMPFAENGTVYFYMGFVTPKEGEQYSELLAVNPTGQGDVTNSGVLWRFKSPILQLLTPLIENGLIYTVDSKNNLFCLNGLTGQTVYTKRLNKKYEASPLYAGGNIFFTSTDGETIVIKEGKNLEIVSRNKIRGEVYATPAILRNSIIIRTKDYLIKIAMNKE